MNVAKLFTVTVMLCRFVRIQRIMGSTGSLNARADFGPKEDPKECSDSKVLTCGNNVAHVEKLVG